MRADTQHARRTPMHDPMVVAFDIPRPWPRRSSHGGRRYWPALITVWHVEPGGHDAFEVCTHSSHWQWHVWHWKVQIRPLQQLKRSRSTRLRRSAGH